MIIPKIGFTSKISPKSLARCGQKVVEVGDNIKTKSGLSFLETSLMEEVRKYSASHGVETARMLDRNSKPIDLLLFELPGKVGMLSNQGIKLFGFDLGLLGKILKMSQLSKGGTNIHSHTANVPLSSVDLTQLFAQKLNKIIAVTPDGTYYCMKAPKKRNLVSYNFVHRFALDELKFEQVNKLKELKLDLSNLQGLKPEDEVKIKEYSDFSIQALKKFAKQCGMDFSHGKI